MDQPGIIWFVVVLVVVIGGYFIGKKFTKQD